MLHRQHRNPPGAPRALRHFLVAVGVSGVALFGGRDALAATYYVGPVGSDGNPGTSASAPWRTIGKANSSVRAGDVVVLQAGSYGESINPASSGTAANRITYVGSLANPAIVTVNDINLTADDYVSVKGVTASGSLTISANTSGSSADFDSVAFCVVRGGLTVSGAWNCVVARNTIGTPNSTTTKWQIDAYPPNLDATTHQLLAPASITSGCTFADNTMYFGAVTGNNAIQFAHNRNCQFLRNRIYEYLPSPANQTHPWITYRIKNNRFEGNRWQLLTHASFEGYMLNMRDSSRFNVFVRDSFIVDPASTGIGKMVFSTSGTWPGTSGYNRYESCFMSINGLLQHQSRSRGDQFIGNVMYTPSSFNPWGDSLVFVHNTFYCTRGLTVDVPVNNALTASTWRYNIFYAATGAVHNYLRTSGASNAINHNLYYSPAEDSTRATYAGRVGAGQAWCTSNGFDCNSRWGNPRLVNPGALGGNFHPAPGSIALSSSLWPDGYVGALAADVPDDRPPGNVADLRLLQVAQESMLIEWTAPGDDGVGGGPVAEYELRFSTTPIDAGNFAAAIPVSPPASPGVPGATATYVLTGLTPLTTYYVALRSRDEAGNLSSISNVATATTTATDVTAPTAIFDLVATP